MAESQTVANSVLPAPNAALVTPDDNNDLTYTTRAISVAGAGAIKVTMEGGQTVIIPSGNLGAGLLHPIRVKRVFSGGTTATGIVAWW